MLLMRDVLRFGVGRNDNQRHAEPINVAATPLCAIHQHLRRRNMIDPASPVIPGNENRCILPVRTVADRVHNRRYPRWPRAVVNARVIRSLAGGSHPDDIRQLIVANVSEYLCRHENHIVGKIGPAASAVDERFANMLNRLRRNPGRESWTVSVTRSSVISPGISVRFQKVGESWMLEARKHCRVITFFTARANLRNPRSRWAVTPGVRRVRRARLLRCKQIARGRRSRCPGKNELMRWKA